MEKDTQMIITAKFTGISSLGYVNGVRYYLIVMRTRRICVKRLDSGEVFVYESLFSFLSDWTDIKEVVSIQKNNNGI